MAGVACVLIAIVCGCNRPNHTEQTAGARPQPPAGTRAFAGAMPQVVVWAWEEPEDLRTLDPARVGVAFLAETVVVGEHVRVVPRRQTLRLASTTHVMAVVRVEAERGFRDTPELRLALARELGLVALRPGLQALQIDFDAVASQYPFYRGVLERLATGMPPGMPLSITALVSWCGETSWLRGLPLAEAVPMFFRMGGPAEHGAHAGTPLSGAAVDPTLFPAVHHLHAPCLGSIGVSTDEHWPPIRSRSRVYVFSPHPWESRELAALNQLDPAMLVGGD